MGDDLILDYVILRLCGGGDIWENFVMVCVCCNV